MAVISEVKRRSPSKGDLFPDLDPAVLARQYERGGATCLSVLTDEEWFGGSAADLRAARAAVRLPVLRKDFTVHRHDVLDARIMGADCVLLIVAALDDDELADFHPLATEVGLDVLVEIHDEAELERALAVDATLIGVNQRDLRDLRGRHRAGGSHGAADARRRRPGRRVRGPRTPTTSVSSVGPAITRCWWGRRSSSTGIRSRASHSFGPVSRVKLRGPARVGR